MTQDRCITPEKSQGQTASLSCFVWMLITKGRVQYRGQSTSARLRERHRPLKRAGDPVHLVILLMSWHCSLGNSPPSPGVCPGKPKPPSPGVQGKKIETLLKSLHPGASFPGQSPLEAPTPVEEDPESVSPEPFPCRGSTEKQHAIQQGSDNPPSSQGSFNPSRSCAGQKGEDSLRDSRTGWHRNRQPTATRCAVPSNLERSGRAGMLHR